MNGFREITHTADIGLEIWADSYENLFTNALNGYYKLALLDDYSSQDIKEYQYTDSESNCENLLISFLSEINYLLMVKKIVLKSTKSIEIIEEDNNYHLSILGQMSALTNPEEDIGTEIKAVTYHQVEITEENGLYQTKIFFDI